MGLSNYQLKELKKRREYIKEYYPKLLSEGYSSANAVAILAVRKKVAENTIRQDVKLLGL